MLLFALTRSIQLSITATIIQAIYTDRQRNKARTKPETSKARNPCGGTQEP
ncbi:hypothetical protein C1H46_045484 [Malus baccata]|uniref:Uncharacterized protein n=1 Tax=Malus baccata TaxID=106549 RepID=A0A540K424_MALBA|nr:hypothetical protein C1H46_045484 [Malus baccata]